jgi:hypothetical protein
VGIKLAEFEEFKESENNGAEVIQRIGENKINSLDQ